MEHTRITKAAEQYFDTLIEKYKKQVNYGNAVEKAKKKQGSSRKDGRKRVKLARRIGAIEEFQTTHDITGVAAMLDKEWMSSEDEGPGLVSQEVWDTQAAKVQTRGTTILEVIPLKWRSIQVSVNSKEYISGLLTGKLELSRLYYALDKIGYQTTKAVNPRFHGFKENANSARPGKKKVFRSMVADTWICDNTLPLFNTEPPFDLGILEIADGELESKDLAALADTEE